MRGKKGMKFRKHHGGWVWHFTNRCVQWPRKKGLYEEMDVDVLHGPICGLCKKVSTYEELLHASAIRINTMIEESKP